MSHEAADATTFLLMLDDLNQRWTGQKGIRQQASTTSPNNKEDEESEELEGGKADKDNEEVEGCKDDKESAGD